MARHRSRIKAATCSRESLISDIDATFLNPLIFGDDFLGKSILDVGSARGQLCLEALRRGAARAVGIEPYVENIEFARAVAAEAALSPEYIQADFEDWESDEQFDVVLCLNFLHQIYDPIHALRKFVTLAREKIVLEVTIPTLSDLGRKRIGLWAMFAIGEPILAMSGTPRNDAFFMTPEALSRFFERHSCCFEPIRLVRSPFKRSVIVIATKRRIDRLTVVAGPTSSGKSTFVAELIRSPELRRKIGIPDKIDAETSALRCTQLPTGEIGHVLFHYDTMRPFGRSRTYSRDPAMTLLLAARSITVLTLRPPHERLTAQFAAANPPSRRKLRLKELYADKNFVDRWYSVWFAHVAKTDRVQRHLLIDNSGEGEYVIREIT